MTDSNSPIYGFEKAIFQKFAITTRRHLVVLSNKKLASARL